MTSNLNDRHHFRSLWMLVIVLVVMLMKTHCNVWNFHSVPHARHGRNKYPIKHALVYFLLKIHRLLAFLLYCKYLSMFFGVLTYFVCFKIKFKCLTCRGVYMLGIQTTKGFPTVLALRSVKKGLCPFLDSFITFDLSHWMVGKNLTQFNLCQTHMSSIYLTVKRTAILIYQCSKFIEDQLT